MKPIDQTRFGYPDGNCFAACVASLLEIGIDDVPDLGDWNGDWTRPLNRWLMQRGLGYVEVDTSERLPRTPYYRLPDKLYVILGGKSPRHLNDVDGQPVGHSVVGRVDGGWKFEVVHDPHPSRDGLGGPVDSVAFLLQLDPAALAETVRMDEPCLLEPRTLGAGHRHQVSKEPRRALKEEEDGER